MSNIPGKDQANLNKSGGTVHKDMKSTPPISGKTAVSEPDSPRTPTQPNANKSHETHKSSDHR